MKESDDYFKQVEQEIREGKFQEGLRARVIAETDGNEKKARALYIKLRIKSLKAERADAIRKAERQKEEDRLAELDTELENLVPLVRRRKTFRIIGLIVGFTIGMVFGIVFFILNIIVIENALPILFFGVMGTTCLGYFVADIILSFIPSQCHLDEIEKERKYLTGRAQSAYLSTILSTRGFIDRACIRLGFEIGTFLRRLLSFLFRD